MSTIDPDARSNTIRAALRPISLVLLVVALIAGPVSGVIMWTAPDPDAIFVPVYLVWLFLVVGAGLLANFTLRNVAALSLAAYCVAGLGGMFMIFGGGGIHERMGTVMGNLAPAITPYVIAAFLYGLHKWHIRLQHATAEHGVNARATVTNVGVIGMYNYVQIFHLTLKFVDESGTTRYFRTHQTSVGGWNVGDTIPIRYNADKPNSAWAIIVNA